MLYCTVVVSILVIVIVIAVMTVVVVSILVPWIVDVVGVVVTSSRNSGNYTTSIYGSW